MQETDKMLQASVHQNKLALNSKALGRCATVILAGGAPSSTRVDNGHVIHKSINRTHK